MRNNLPNELGWHQVFFEKVTHWKLEDKRYKKELEVVARKDIRKLHGMGLKTKAKIEKKKTYKRYNNNNNNNDNNNNNNSTINNSNNQLQLATTCKQQSTINNSNINKYKKLEII